MMRSLFSGVSGLKTHQTRMDVIGNNIANVNTTAYKSKSINFSDMLYQTTQSATAPNDSNNTAGTNARQIGLGVKTGAINTSITTEGSSQSTGNPFDLKLTGEAFFVVTDGTNTYFTRDGSFDVDASGNLTMASTGYIVEGWTSTDAETGTIIQDSVKPIKVLSASNENYPASYTTAATISGIIDKNDEQLETDNGKLINIQVLDNRGYEYNLKFGITPVSGTSTREVTNTETNYSLPTNLKATAVTDVDSYVVYDSNGNQLQTLSDASDAAKDAKSKALALLAADSTKVKNDTANGKNYVEINVVDATTYGTYTTGSDEEASSITTNGSLLDGNVIRVYLDESTDYTYTSNGKTTTLNISDTALKNLYTSTDGVNYTLNDSAGKLKVVEKAYTVDGVDMTDYEIYLADGTTNAAIGNAITSLTYSDVSSMLDSTNPSSVYYTTEQVEAGAKEGSYEMKLIGMTDSDGEEVSGWSDLALATTAAQLLYNTGNGNFISVDGADAFTVNLSSLGSNFSNVSFDMTNTSNVNNGGKSTVEGTRDDGYKVGTLTGVSIGQDGTITANYDNGMQKAIAQIAVATFANAMGLENAGDNLYQQTSNSGEFDGVGVDIKASGTGYMTTGVLEMSNVDLATEFTNMITTQRGFQANSRIITTSDTLLEELVNLKR